MKKISLLFNPSSGGGYSSKKKAILQRLFSDAGIEHRFYESSSEEHLREMVKTQAAQYDAIVGIGGDTTFSIIAQELVKIKIEKKRIPVLGFIGIGSANDISRSLGMVKAGTLIHSIIRWRTGEMDVGELSTDSGSEIFLGTVSSGLGTTVNRYLDSWVRRHRILRKIKVIHPVITGMAGIRHSFKKQLIPETVHLKWEGGEGNFNFSLLAFLNIPYYAGGLELSPLGSPYSGMLECCIVQTGSFSSSVAMGLRVIIGSKKDNPGMTRISSPYFTAKFSRLVDLQYDGEPVSGIRNVNISMMPKYLDVFVPIDS